MAGERESGEPTPDFGERYDAVIVGAGIGGLACGALLAAEGLDVLVAERHDRPGGFVTDYERKGYRFQVPHLVGGCGPGGYLTRVMDHLGITMEFKRVDPYVRFVYPEHDISVPSDAEEFKQLLKENFQPQTDNINHFFSVAARLYKAMDVRMLRKPRGAASTLKAAAYPLVYPRMVSLAARGRTLQQVLDSYFTEDRMKAVLATMWPFLGAPPWEVSALSMIGMMKSFSEGAYIPSGGYGALADAFAKAFTDRGGKLLLGHEATAINAEGGVVCGVELQPRTKIETSVVVSDADSRRTFLSLADRQRLPHAFLGRVEEGPVSISGFTIHLGMAKTIEDPGFANGPVLVQPSYDHRSMYEAVRAAGDYPDPERISWGVTVHSAMDPTLAPEGKSCLDIVVPGVPYGFMERWGIEGGVRGDRYRAIKEKYAEAVVEAVSGRFPDLIGNVEAYDISTPVTFERYTMATDGCWYDTAPVPAWTLARRPGPRTPMRGLFVTGSKSVFGGGIYASVVSGLLAADSVLKGGLGDLFND